ncbi:MAG: hypothetical protein HY235_04835 [Acidobacteria bacterium]|nr:hypothetical protein [Acidobacteriota bacterium]
MPFPYIFTFYSYKGGVGRSMALLNVAYTLVGRGRHVLVVDMDLEAPGLSRFLSRSKELAPPAAAHPKDILTLLREAMAALGAGGEVTEKAKNLPPVSNYIRVVAEGKLTALRPRMGQLGHFDVLGTDLTPGYYGRLAELGLAVLPPQQLIDLSRILHHYFKGQEFSHRPLGLEEFEPSLPTHYDYVLVDSRTGVTEIGGLCVGPLADRLVVITALNDQNVYGTCDLLKEAGVEPAPRPVGAAAWDEADLHAGDPENPSLGPKPTIVVASPVPAGEIGYKRERLAELEKVLGIRPVPLSYHPQMALMESVFVRDYREEYLAAEYERLATRIMAQVCDDPQRLALKSAVLWNEKKQPAAAISCVLRLAPHEPALGVPLLQGLGNVSAASDYDFWAVRQLYAFLSQDRESRPIAMNNWGNALSDQAKTKSGEEAGRLFEEAGRKYAEAIRLKPDNPEALSNWGAGLLGQAKTKSGEEAGRLFEEAGRKCAEAIRLKPDYPEALYNWGNALVGQARTKSREEAGRLFEEAGRKYAEAIRLKPDDPKALSNWGGALLDQAQTKSGEERNQLMQEARQKLIEAERVLAGAGAFNMACLEALAGDAKEAVRWLRVLDSFGERISKARLAAEKDFDGVRGQPDFAGFAASLPEA